MKYIPESHLSTTSDHNLNISEFPVNFVRAMNCLKRVFANTTNLALVEVNTNQVVVKAPEPSVNVALLISSGVIGIALKRKRKVNTSTCFLK